MQRALRLPDGVKKFSPSDLKCDVDAARWLDHSTGHRDGYFSYPGQLEKSSENSES